MEILNSSLSVNFTLIKDTLSSFKVDELPEDVNEEDDGDLGDEVEDCESVELDPGAGLPADPPGAGLIGKHAVITRHQTILLNIGTTKIEDIVTILLKLQGVHKKRVFTCLSQCVQK